jgi:2-hydroxy-3-keto-5-methylthiopentenyl-1-phosphate phosphatase
MIDAPPLRRDPADRGIAPLRVLLDFDGTLVEPNVAIVLVERFCPDGPRVAHEVDLDLHAGKITLREAWARQVALLPLDRMDEMSDFVVREVPLRRGARELLSLLDAHHVPTSIVSGGLDFFIRPVLARENIRYPVFSDTLAPNGDGRLRLDHPFGHSTCRLCGICKAQLALQLKDPGTQTVFIGDGSTDKFAAEVADIVFARRRLKDYCAASGIPFYPFEEFGPVTAQLARWLDGTDPLPASRRAGLGTSPCPISHTLYEVGSAPVPPLRRPTQSS